MGLDGVDLIMECEDEFGICIPDEEASKVVTVADLYALICRLRDSKMISRNPEATIRVISDTLRDMGISIEEPTVALRLEDIVRPAQRHRFWRLLEQRLGRSLSPLAMPQWGGAAAFGWITLCLVVGALLRWQWAIFGLLFGAVTGVIVIWLMKHLCPKFPSGWETIQQVINQTGPMSASQVWQTLVRVISEQLGVSVNKITMESRFIQDLNVD